MSQLRMFDTTVYKWPCRFEGEKSRRYQPEAGLKTFYRPRFRPILSENWEAWEEALPSGERVRRLRCYWKHPSPLTRADYEYDRVIACSINPDGFYWTVRWFARVGWAGFHPWSAGKSESLEEAKAQALRQLRIKAPQLFR